MIPATPRSAGDAELVALLRGDLRELDEVEAAARIAAAIRVPLVGCILSMRPRAGRLLLADLAGTAVERWLAWPDLAERLRSRGVRGLLISAETWRMAARALWPALHRSPVLVQRRRPGGLPATVLVAADSATTTAAVTPIVHRMLVPPRHVTVAYASVPSWAGPLAAALGYPACAERFGQDEFPWPLDAGMRGVCVNATPFWGIRGLAHELRPDLVVLGLHRHRVPLPSLAHPTAWALSRDLPTDVLLSPVG